MTKKELDADPVRRLIETRCRKMRLKMNAMSEHIGKNVTYMQQYLRKGTPRVLPEDARHAIAEALGLSEAALRTGAAPLSLAALPATPSPLVRMADGRQLSGSGAGAPDVPVFSDTDVIDPAAATDFTHRPPSLLTAGGAFAVWISRPRAGRLRSGDLAFVRPTQPPRQRDMVIVLSDEHRIVAIGELIEQVDKASRIEVADKEIVNIPYHGNRLYKVMLVAMP